MAITNIPNSKIKRWLWILKLKLIHLYRTASAMPGIGAGIFIGFFSIIVTIYLMEYIGKTTLAINIILAFIFSLFLGGFLARITLDPFTYAQVIISGRPLEEKLYYIAKRTLRVTMQFENAIKHSGQLLDDLYEFVEREDIDEDPGKYERALINIWNRKRKIKWWTKACQGETIALDVVSRGTKLIVDQHNELERIEKMKMSAANELGIPRRRFCDHIIQFTPSLYKDRVQKYVQDWYELHVTIPQRGAMLNVIDIKYRLRRMSGIITQLKKIERINEQRIQRQFELIHHIDLHRYIHEIASSHSMSGALLIYSKALSYLATDANRRLQSWGGNIRRNVFEVVDRRFRIMYRKQKSYPGYDPHDLLLQLYEYVLEKSVFAERDRPPIEKIIQLLKQFKLVVDKKQQYMLIISGVQQDDIAENKASHVEEPEAENELRKELANCQEELNKHKQNISKFNEKMHDTSTEAQVTDHLDQLSQIYTFTANFLTEFKEQIIDVFANGVFPQILSETKGTCFIITHGYSKTVREIIKHSLREEDSQKYYVFITQDGQSDDFDNRLLKFELQRETSEPKRYFKNIATGSLEILYQLMNPEKDSVLIILGAESYDNDEHLVHPKGLRDDYLIFREKLISKKAVFFSVVAAEKFKGQKDSITNSEPFDDHFDRIEIFQNTDIDMIITNEDFKKDKNYQALKTKIKKIISDRRTEEGETHIYDAESAMKMIHQLLPSKEEPEQKVEITRKKDTIIIRQLKERAKKPSSRKKK